ncbi:MAG: aminotransferase class I/II-fold pyridoxal phosphate-dependent enzyme [Clostridium sp.]|nr:aminotransferase class I/II-fold pyridoxal phosphate-dependent enzyme [Clostridium sp.]
MRIRANVDFYGNRFLMFVLDRMAYEYEKEGKDVIRLTLGKAELPLKSEIVKSMQAAMEDDHKSSLVFPEGLPQLKEELARYYHGRYEVDIPPKNFIISVGTSTLFRNLFYLLAGEGDEILLPLPYYSLYRFCGLLVGAKIKYYRIDPDTMRLDRDSFRENFTEKTRIVVINTPGNPLGNILTTEELYEMDRIVNGQAAIINDEIYANVVFDQEGTSVMQLEGTKSTFITTDAFSKGYRMYCRRVGYAIVPDELVTPLTVIQHHTLLTTDPVVQFGAIAALSYQDEVQELVRLYKERRDYTISRLGDLKDVKVYPSEGGFYITLDCGAFMKNRRIQDSLELAVRIMERQNVAAVPGADFGLPQALRLSFSNLRYREGIDRLHRFFLREGGAAVPGHI